MIEEEMMRDGFEYLSHCPQYNIVKNEVPFLSRCIDVVLVDQNGIIISIEFKVSKWRHAIEQAINHKLGSDKAYICLPKRNISKKLSLAIEAAGVGLLLYDPTSSDKIIEAIPAPARGDNIPVFRNFLLETLAKID